MGCFLRRLILVKVVTLLIINLQLKLTNADIGVNYGLLGDNLPSPSNVINLYKKEGIALLKLYDPNPDVLEALRGSEIKVSLGVKNEDIKQIAMNLNTATQWVNTNIVAYAKDVNIKWITLGNEIVPGGPDVDLIPQAMNNIQSALNFAGLTNIKVSTVVKADVLGVSYPPSAGDFSKETTKLMEMIVAWLASTNNPLIINVYPYLAFASDPQRIPLDFALFNAKEPIVDGQFKYYSLFESMVDAFIAALDKNGGENVTVVVSETGWPTAGNAPYTSAENAQVYNQRLIDKMKQGGTPRRPSENFDIFIFAMFNENKKPIGIEQNWGIHYPNMTPVYPLHFN